MNRIVRTILAVAAIALLAGGTVLANDATAPGPRAGRGPGAVLQKLAQDLGVTDAQKEQIKPMLQAFRDQEQQRRESMRARAEALLTPEQKAQFEKMQADRGQGRHRGGWKQLGLSDEQITQLKALREESQAQRQQDIDRLVAQVKTVLTPEQGTRLDQFVQERRAQRGPGRGQGPGAGRQGR